MQSIAFVKDIVLGQNWRWLPQFKVSFVFATMYNLICLLNSKAKCDYNDLLSHKPIQNYFESCFIAKRRNPSLIGDNS